MSENPLVSYGKDQLRRQWLANLGLMAFVISGAKRALSTNPREAATPYRDALVSAREVAGKWFDDLVEQGRRRVQSNKAN